MGAITLLSSSPWAVVEVPAQPGGLLKPSQDQKMTEHGVAQAVEQDLLDAPERGWALDHGAGSPRGKVQGNFESDPRVGAPRGAWRTARSGRVRGPWPVARRVGADSSAV